MNNYIKVWIKYCLSYLKKQWFISDYPIRLKRQGEYEEIKNGDIKKYSYVAQIINWYQMAGIGNTTEEAYKNLEENLENYRKKYLILPRPGKKVPVEFASCDEIGKYEKIEKEYFEKVIGMSSYDCFTTDETRISDFWGIGIDENTVIIKTKEIYGLDISNIIEEPLVEILKYISINQKLKP